VILILKMNQFEKSFESGMWKQQNIFCFRFQLHIKLVASKFASASSFFLQSASASTSLPHVIKNASGSSKSQMLPSLLPLPTSFFKVFPLPHLCFESIENITLLEPIHMPTSIFFKSNLSIVRDKKMAV